MNKKVLVVCLIIFAVIVGIVCAKLTNNNPKVYEDVSSICIYNGSEVIDDKKINIDSFFDENEICELDIEVENLNEDSRQYELIELVNYETRNIDESKKIKSLTIESNKTEKCKVFLNKKDFKYKTNSLAFVLRVDTKKHSSENELVSTSTTIVRDFVVYNDKSKNENPLFSEKASRHMENNSSDNLVIKVINEKKSDNDFLVEKKSGEYICQKVKMKKSIEYILICLENSNQVDINGDKYIKYSGNSDELFRIMAPEENGKFEVEFIALPNILVNENFNDEILEMIRVHSSNRYTIEVK